MKTAYPLVVGLLASPVTAQISFTASAVTPITCRATAGAVADIQTLPAGPLTLPTIHQASASAQPAPQVGSMFVHVLPNGSALGLASVISLGVSGSASAPNGSADASVDPFEVVVNLTSAGSRPVTIEGIIQQTVSPGQPMPLVEIDVGNDGSIEWTTAVGVPQANPVALVLDTFDTPVLVRCSAAVSTAASPGGQIESSTSIDIRVEADNNIDISEVVAGCTTPLVAFGQAPTHDGLRLAPLFGNAMVAAFGLSTSPVMLPNPAPVACLLLPSPDLIVFVPAAGFDLPVPASVRPISIFAQAAIISQGLFWTGTGYHALAH